VLPPPDFVDTSLTVSTRHFREERYVLEFGEFQLTRRGGDHTAAPDARSAPGESGVSVTRVKFDEAAHFSARSRQHLIFFQLSPHLRLECNVAGRRLLHETFTGSLAICPAGADCSVTSNAGADALVLAVDPSRLSLAAAEDSAIEAQLIERLSGYDRNLQSAAQTLASQSVQNYPEGPLAWNETASGFVNGLVSRHTATPPRPARGRLGAKALQKIRDYIHAHLDQPIEVNDLADLAGRSAFHFTRVFARSVGMTPYRYVVHLRLQAALRRVREGRMSLAQIAADTGFADQSHLSRWIRRVHGVAPSELA
jgi:AraC family transcriptional regulator